MYKTSQKVSKFKFEQVLNPVGAVILLLLLILPVLAFFNLNASSLNLTQSVNDNVLGATVDNSTVSIGAVNPTNEMFTMPMTKLTDDGTFELRTQLRYPRNANGRISTPLIKLRNNTPERQNLKIVGYFAQRSASKLSFTLDGETYPLQSYSHRSFSYEISLKPHEDTVMTVEVENQDAVNFPEDVVIQISPQK